MKSPNTNAAYLFLRKPQLIYWILFLSFFILSSLTEIKAYTTLIKTGDSNARAKAELIKVFQQGGKITFEEGQWTINLKSSESKIKADVEILGANLLGSNLNYMGAYENANLEKTKITFEGSIVEITKTCSKFVVKNLRWNKTGIRSEDFHIPEVDLNNVTIDISSWAVGRWVKRNLRVLDGLSGSIEHVTFRGFFQAVAFQRNVKKDAYPFSKSGKLIFNRCLFDPDPTIVDNNLAGVTYDSGNDEYAALLDLEGTEIKNSHFIDCRIAISKCSNLFIAGNLFQYENSKKEPIHIEEFSKDILIDNNIFRFSGTKTRGAIDIGAVQTSTDITITNNVAEQTNQLTNFVMGSGAKNITINNNEIKNPKSRKYITLWGCGNKNVKVGSDGVAQPGLAPSNLDIRTNNCTTPKQNDTYYIIWNGNEYLGLVDGKVNLVTRSAAPEDNNFKWEIKLDNISRLENYYTMQNLNGTDYYLEIFKGPTQPERIGQEGKPYKLFGEKVIAKAVSNYATIDRKPGFGIYEKGGKYALLSGGNERKSEIIKDGNTAAVYMLENNQTNAHYNWSLTKTSKTLSIDEVELTSLTIYPNPTTDIINVPESLTNELWSVYDVLGHKIIEISNTTAIDLSNLPRGLYLLKTENGFSKKIVRQ